MYLGISTKGTKLGFAKHAERGKRKGLQATLKKLYLLIVVSYVYVLKYISLLK